MKRAIYLKKLSMSSFIDESGLVVPVTILKYIDQEFLGFKTTEKHGYNAIQYGFGLIKEKKLNKAKMTYFKKKKKSPKKHICELRLDNDAYDEVVQTSEDQEALNNIFSLEAFEENDIVNIAGKSKGKGFQGTIKAHGFHRGPMSHGSKNHRLPGSIGAGTDPARVFKGTKMAKRMGNKRVTVRNLKVVKIDKETNQIILKGAIPGKSNDLILMYK
ncbi:50S ribosomal protein L3 [bacterium]|nr:50S ribosomal protein L3 [Actinomycetota bacterium]MBE33854.1 50S ribosomal protein L3 [bacterium]|tara:strand:- start:2874 stop:3521 length:648 start_codon:yes stop_codon:yes gene_type:complete